MKHESVHAADDGVSYEDGDVVYAGRAPEPNNEPIMTLWTPELCDVADVIHELAPRKLTDPGILSDNVDAASNGRTISDVDEYIGDNYPTYVN